MVTVWGRRNSANVQKVLWLLDDLDTPWQHRDAGGKREPETRRELLARNPNGLVPVLEDDGLTLWESNAILRHLVPNRAALGTLRQCPL
ncbi:MAG: glutathione S-transferase N-terminal domain-containing protein [Arhodomonas sp.]|nr:glutathione S-transferase N-terminal domain-containing protein [Arhodomonas sp.]